MPRKPQAPTPSSLLALGFTKEELAAALITVGIFAGPYGKAVMDSTSDEALDGVADAALHMYDALLRRIEARHA